MLMLTACVAINSYFPAAAAEKGADEIIKDIQSNAPQKPQQKPDLKPQSKSERSDCQVSLYKAVDKASNFAISSAQAAEVDLAVDSAEIRQLTSAMEKRFSSLQSFNTAGAIGIKAGGFLVVKDAASVSLKDRNQVNKLIAAENADRQALYQAIANGHPEWTAQIKSTFAARWISMAGSINPQELGSKNKHGT